MEEVSYEHREHVETNLDSSYKVTTLVKVQRKKILTNPDIESRKRLKKFGQASGYEKGAIEGSIQLDDKEIFLLPFGQEKNDETIAKFVTTRNHRDKFDQLNKREQEIKKGKIEDNRTRQTYTIEPTSFSIKVTNVPIGMSQDELEDFFAIGPRPRKIYRPVSRDDNKVRDFVLIHYNTKSEATDAILMFNNIKCGVQILTAEVADNRNQPSRPSRPFIKK